ncbi:hypothetical protein LA080_010092 [Diaporthe eres]|nr:hypothetical protein LA080_010092 [Diaporthe eres]
MRFSRMTDGGASPRPGVLINEAAFQLCARTSERKTWSVAKPTKEQYADQMKSTRAGGGKSGSERDSGVVVGASDLEQH